MVYYQGIIPVVSIHNVLCPSVVQHSQVSGYRLADDAKLIDAAKHGSQIWVTLMFKCFKQNIKTQNIYEEKRVCN